MMGMQGTPSWSAASAVIFRVALAWMWSSCFHLFSFIVYLSTLSLQDILSGTPINSPNSSKFDGNSRKFLNSVHLFFHIRRSVRTRLIDCVALNSWFVKVWVKAETRRSYASDAVKMISEISFHNISGTGSAYKSVHGAFWCKQCLTQLKNDYITDDFISS